jgi:hypothetical protein
MKTQSTTTTAFDTKTTTLTGNETAMSTTTPPIHAVHTPNPKENPMTTEITITTATDTTTTPPTGNETAMTLTTDIPSCAAIANDVASSLTTPMTGKDTAMPSTTPRIHAVPISPTTQEISMTDLDRSLTTDRSLSTPRIDISLSDPVAALAAGPANDPVAPVHDELAPVPDASSPAHDALTPAVDTSPPASEKRLTVGYDGAPFQPRVLPERLGFETRCDYAEQELDWAHSPSALDPQNAGRRALLMGWLERLKPADRTVITLRYDRRVLSPMLADWVYLSPALVVAIDALASGLESLKDGIPGWLERATVSQLEALIRTKRTRRIDVIQRRAGRRFDEAVNAFARVRGHVALVVPTSRAGHVTTTTPITAGEMTA